MTTQNGNTDTVLGILNRMLENQEALVRASRALADEVAQAPSEWAIPFRPFFRIGDLVQVIRSGGVDQVAIRYVSALPNYRHDFGQISASSTDNEATELEVDEGQMAQFRFSPAENLEVEIDNPQGVEQWRTSSQRFRILPWLNAPDIRETEAQMREIMSQFWVFEKTTPRFNLFPLPSGQQTEAYVEFFGWRYDFILVNQLEGAERQEAERQLERGNFRLFRLNGRP